MEITLRRLEGVDKVAISIEKQLFAVTYEEGTRFQPEALREAVAAADVEVVRFHVAARGRVEESQGRRFFVAGEDRFVLVDSPQIPAGVPLEIMATVNDSTIPMEVTVDDYKLLESE
jgi:hypothetical protein